MRQCYRQTATTGATCHGRRNLATVDIWGVIRRDHDIDATAGLPGRNDDHSTIGQGNDQVGGRCLANRGGINDYATRLADRRGSAKNQVRSNVGVRRRWDHQVVAVGVQQAHFLAIERSGKAQAVSREANRRVDPARRFFEHHEAMTTAQRTTTARCRRASCGSFKLCSRVDTRSNRLLQLFHRRRSLGSRLAQIGAAVRCFSAPLAIATQIEQTAISQFQSNRATRTSEHFFTGQ